MEVDDDREPLSFHAVVVIIPDIEVQIDDSISVSKSTGELRKGRSWNRQVVDPPSYLSKCPPPSSLDGKAPSTFRHSRKEILAVNKIMVESHWCHEREIGNTLTATDTGQPGSRNVESGVTRWLPVMPLAIRAHLSCC